MQVNVAIIGGGPAGSALARLLSEAGLKAVLFDDSDQQEVRWGETSPPQLRELLVQLNLWNEFRELDLPQVRGISAAWGSRDPHHNDYITQPPGHGWHIPRGHFDRWLQHEARLSGADICTVGRVKHVERKSRSWLLTLETGRRHMVKAEYLIDAAGRFPRFTGGVQRIAMDRLVVLRATVSEEPGLMRARPLLEASRSGWWFSIGDPNGLLHIFHFSDADLLPRQYRSSAVWSELIRDAPLTSFRVNGKDGSAIPRIAPSRSQHAVLPFPEGVIAVGDAALALDPLSGQGICFALESAIQASNAILSGNCDSTKTTQQYGAWLEARLTEYCDVARSIYSQEGRWKHEEFWTRRNGNQINDMRS